MSKSTITVASILKDEAHIITRMLASVVDWAEDIFIIDTGSTDDTVRVVKDYLKENFHGTWEVKSEEWVDFAVNRTSLVKQASKRGSDYLLLMDADHVLEVPDASAFENLTADSYLVLLPSGGLSYFMPYMVKTCKPWFYLSPTHEYITCDEPFLQEKHPTLTILHYEDGGTRWEKFDRDLSLLERAYEQDPDNIRTVFYLAQTYHSNGDYDASKKLYEKRVSMGGWDEEIYWSYFMIAEMTHSADDYLRAWDYRIRRPEVAQRLAKHFNELGQHNAAYLAALLKPDTFCEDLLFVEKWCWDYGADFERAIAAFYTGRKAESQETFLELLERDDLPLNYRESIKSNLTCF